MSRNPKPPKAPESAPVAPPKPAPPARPKDQRAAARQAAQEALFRAIPQGLAKRAVQAAEDFRRVPPVEGVGAAEWLLFKINRNLARAGQPLIERPGPELAEGVQAIATVNGGWWKVACPWCGSRQYASRQDRRFVCVDDHCLETFGRTPAVTVLWPDDATVQAIETELALRLNPNHRHWDPRDTPEKLRAQTVEKEGVESVTRRMNEYLGRKF